MSSSLSTSNCDIKKGDVSKREKIIKKTSGQYLLIVESSSKCASIEKYLGSSYKCISCNGHLRTIDGLKSIDAKNDYRVEYTVDPDKKAHLSKMKEVISTFPKSQIILATDHDREGEAIAWHLCDIFGLSVETTPRIVFHEVTRNALIAAVANPGLIDMPMVRAQQARQILDVLVGFKISPLLWRRVSDNSLSAGRCQTPALRLVYDNEIEAKKKSETATSKHSVSASFFPQNLRFDLSIEFNDEAETLNFLKQSVSHTHTLSVGSQKVSTRSPPKPFNTSALLQAVSNSLHLGAKETMACAQVLYQLGHITYMRTENRKFSPVFTDVASKYIREKWSDAHVNPRISIDLTNNDTNNPHEAIRVTNIQMHDLVLISDKNPLIDKVYRIIWLNTIQSCMSDATFNTLPLEIDAPLNTKYKHTIEIPKFQGFLAAVSKPVSSGLDAATLSGMVLRFQTLKDKIVKYNQIETSVGFTGRHSRYTEASLIDRLEELGVGRPSTFSMLTDVIQTRGYVKRTNIEGKSVECHEYLLRTHNIISAGEKELDLGGGVKVIETTVKKMMGAEQRKLVIDPVGIIVIEFLVEAFPELFSYDYTKAMEARLDAVAAGKEDWVNVCRDCDAEIKRLTKALAKIEKTSYNVDDNYVVVFQKTGAVLKHKTQTVEEGKPVFKSIKKSLKLDLEKLSAGEYTYADLVELDNNVLGEWNGTSVFVKNGKYGAFMEYTDEDGNTQNKSLKTILKPVEQIVFEDVLPILSGDEIKDTANKMVLRVFTPSLSVRKGKFGPYIYYKTRTMDKPSFLNLRNFGQGFGVCSVKDMVDWVEKTYKVKV
jgi:DNA topoisomerase-1